MNKTNGVQNVLRVYLVLILRNFGLKMDEKWPGLDQSEFKLLGKREENISKKFFHFY